MRIDVRAAARDDLDGIYDSTLAAHGEAQAERYVRSIWAAVDRLVAYPEIGIARDVLRPGLRSFPSGEDRIFYAVWGIACRLCGCCTWRWTRGDGFERVS